MVHKKTVHCLYQEGKALGWAMGYLGEKSNIQRIMKVDKGHCQDNEIMMLISPW